MKTTVRCAGAFPAVSGARPLSFPAVWVMRIVSLILVAVGGLALAWEACAGVLGVSGRVPPVVSGIVLVFGLLVLAADRRDEN